jgi:hypothetical protein
MVCLYNGIFVVDTISGYRIIYRMYDLSFKDVPSGNQTSIEHPPFMDYFPIGNHIYIGFSIDMFDHQGT